jgi:hypothetical protein
MKRLFASAVAMLALSASAHAQNVTVGDVKRELMLTAVLTGQIRQGILTTFLMLPRLMKPLITALTLTK